MRSLGLLGPSRFKQTGSALCQCASGRKKDISMYSMQTLRSWSTAFALNATPAKKSDLAVRLSEGLREEPSIANTGSISQESSDEPRFLWIAERVEGFTSSALHNEERLQSLSRWRLAHRALCSQRLVYFVASLSVLGATTGLSEVSFFPETSAVTDTCMLVCVGRPAASGLASWRRACGSAPCCTWC